MGEFEVESTVTGTVWAVERVAGERVEVGDTVVVLECMKMEIPVLAERAGTVVSVRCAEGQSVSELDVLMVIQPD